MSESYTFQTVDHFRAGTVGEPGHRIFYIQIQNNGVSFNFRCEKTQISALSDHLARLLSTLTITDFLPKLTGDFEPPTSDEWTVANVIIAHDELADRIVIRFTELAEDEEAATATASLSREQALAFTVLSAQLMEQGRPPCPWCDRPLDDEHICPRRNGHGIH